MTSPATSPRPPALQLPHEREGVGQVVQAQLPERA